jgi:nicotinamidase-related amidase
MPTLPQDLLKRKRVKRIFVCGLCLDVCVLDTCVNAVDYGFAGSTYQILDACRAPHIYGVGTFGSG